MKKHVLSMMVLAPELGDRLLEASRIMWSMQRKPIPVAAAARQMMALGIEAFMSQPDVVAHLAKYPSASMPSTEITEKDPSKCE